MNFEFTPPVIPPVMRQLAHKAFRAAPTRESLVLAGFNIALTYREHLVAHGPSAASAQLPTLLQRPPGGAYDMPDWFKFNDPRDYSALQLAQCAYHIGLGSLIAEHLTCPLMGYCETIGTPRETDFHKIARLAVRALITNCTDEAKAKRSLPVTQANANLSKLIKLLFAVVENDIQSSIGCAQSWSAMALDHEHWDYWRQPENADGDVKLLNAEEPKKPPHWQLIDMVVSVQSLEQHI